MKYVVFDIGGTKTRVASSNNFDELQSIESFKTPTDFKKGMTALIEQIKALAPDGPTAIAGGIRGVLNEEHTGIANDSTLAKWAGKSVLKELEKEFGKIPMWLENDSAIAGVGEAIYGAGKGLEIVVYHTVSTGVGGVKIEEGEIDDAHIGFEPGHQILDIDRTILGEEIEPTLENLVSGTGVANRMGVKAYEIPQSDMLWDELAGYLGQGLRNTILYWSPDAIVLGGSMIIGDPRIELEPIRKATVEALDGFVECPLIVTADLGDEAGLWGCLAILKKRL